MSGGGVARPPFCSRFIENRSAVIYRCFAALEKERGINTGRPVLISVYGIDLSAECTVELQGNRTLAEFIGFRKGFCMV